MRHPITGLAVRVTAFVAVCLAVALLLGLAVANARFGPSQTYHAAFRDVSGLVDGAEVRAAGVAVGRVEEVGAPADGQVVVTFSASPDVPLADTSLASVRYKNLTGDRYLELAAGRTPGTRLAEGGTLPVANTAAALDLDQLYNGFRPLLQALDPQEVNRLSGSLIEALQGEGPSIEGLLADVGSLTSILASRDQVIGEVITNLQTSLTTIGDRSGAFSDLIVRLQELTRGLAADRQAIGASLPAITDLADRTSGLLDEVRPQLVGLNEQTRRLAGMLNEPANRTDLLDAIQLSPDAYKSMAGLGTYGSFFNFYLCAVQVRFTGPDGNAALTPVLPSDAPRCLPK